jgi:ABC-type taurine transport system substrate-binding protein
VRTLSDTSLFLKEQKKADKVLASYQGFVTPRFAKLALAR